METKEENQAVQEAASIEETSHMASFFFFLLAAVCISFGIWASLGTLDVVSQAEGEVVPISRIRLIQHLEGGIIKEIMVKEGDTVVQDQPLAVLESTARGADVGELRLRIQSLNIDAVRYEAEAIGKKKLAFEKKWHNQHKKLVQQAQELFTARQNSLISELAKQNADINQRTEDISEISARLKHTKRRLQRVQEQLTILKNLMKTKLSNRYQELDLLKESDGLQSRIDEDKAALKRAKSTLKQSENGMIQIRDQFHEKARTGLEETRRTLEEYGERLHKYEDQLKRTVIRSPVAGTVKVIYASSKKGVVPPGGTVMEIVPSGDRLVINAKLPPQEIGHVHTGQEAIIQLASADASRFGKLAGTVLQISPDTIKQEDGITYYTVRIETEQSYFENKGRRYDLTPGVIVSVGIITDQSSVLEYIISPFISSMTFSLTER
jgi:membrane fusion protein, adhesin transport system